MYICSIYELFCKFVYTTDVQITLCYLTDNQVRSFGYISNSSSNRSRCKRIPYILVTISYWHDLLSDISITQYCFSKSRTYSWIRIPSTSDTFKNHLATSNFCLSHGFKRNVIVSVLWIFIVKKLWNTDSVMLMSKIQ